MRVLNVKRLALGTAVMFGLGAGSALAEPIFTVDPTSVGYNLNGTAVQGTSIAGNAAALVTINGDGSQTESGYLQLKEIKNNNSSTDTGVTNQYGPSFSPAFVALERAAGEYGLYIKFTDTVTGLTGSGAGQTGTVTSFEFALYADEGLNDTFTSYPDITTNPVVGGTTSDDKIIAVGSLITGTAGFLDTTDAPHFQTLSSFILCNADGTGTLGGVNVGASGNSQGTCGGFNGSSYFTAPGPFYASDFNDAEGTSGAGTSSSIHVIDGTHFALTDTTVTLSFRGGVPEPITVSLFGAGLAGAAAFGRRRKAKKA